MRFDEEKFIAKASEFNLKILVSGLVNFLYNFYIEKSFESKNNENDEDFLKKKSYIIDAQKWFVLEVVDKSWRQHIVNLDHIREGIGLRGYGQKTPLIEYKQEAFELFKRMIGSLIEEIVGNILNINIKDFNAALLEDRRQRELEEIQDSLHEQHKEKEDGDNRKARRLTKKKK